MKMFNPRKGYALATILVLLGVCMFGAAALATISVLESKLSRSQTEGTVAYYVAEAGMTDAIWRLNNTSSYKTALLAGTLNTTYSATDKPATGQGFSVTMTNTAQGAGYGSIVVTGTVNNGTFTAKRRIEASVFIGSDTTPTIGTNAFFGGGSLSITNGSSAINVVSGDIYARGGITINQATVTMPGRYMQTTGNYVENNADVDFAGVHAANYPPAPADIAVPGYDFTQYNSLPTNRCTAGQYASQTQLRCTAAQFQSLIGSSTNFNFPNQVVYISGNLAFNNWAKNKTITVNGLFVVNGDLSTNGSASNFTFNLNDPGTGRSGIVVRSNMSNSSGTWNINGIIYASGTMGFTNADSVVVDGALIAGGSVNINTGLIANVTFNATRASAVLGSVTTPTAVQVLHWEEEY